MGRRVDADGGLRFGRGRGRPWGRVARVFLRSKVESSEWSNFGGERLLGAANGDGCLVEPRRMQEGRRPSVEIKQSTYVHFPASFYAPPATDDEETGRSEMARMGEDKREFQAMLKT